jgi:hypothetical protein
LTAERLYKTLTYAGAIPFVACAFLPFAGYTQLGPLGDWSEVIVTYGLAIVCFLAGTHWAFELARPGTYAVSLFVLSNVVVLAVWVAALVAPVGVALGAQLIAFLVLLRVDRAVAQSGGTPAEYFTLRQRITTIVTIALATAIAATWLT